MQNADWRSYEDFEQGYTQPTYVEPQYTQPVSVEPQYNGPAYAQPEQTVPAPAPAAPPRPPMVQRPGIAPIQAPPNTLLLGSALLPRPDVIPEREAQQVNNTLSALQADGGNLVTSLGVPTKQADRLAAGTVTGVVVGGAAGALAVGAPAAVLGAAGGAVIGTVVGIGVGTTLATVFIPGVGLVIGPVIGGVNGALIGAGVGALALGVPAAMAGGALGALFGGIVGATAFGGEDVVIEEPAPAPAPEAVAPAPLWTPPAIDTRAAFGLTQQVVDQAEAVPGGSGYVEQARDFVAEAPVYAAQAAPQVDATVTQVREAALAQPGGGQVVAAVEQAGANAAGAAAPVIEQATAFAGAVVAGLNA